LKVKTLIQVSFQLEGDDEERNIRALWFEVSHKGKMQISTLFFFMGIISSCLGAWAVVHDC
jgi:hypothetical protein